MLTKAYFTFFKDLAANNHREWFHSQKDRYERDVDQPFKALVTELASSLGESYPFLKALDPKKAIFRIHRDTRFSQDKTPYKMHKAASFNVGGKKAVDELGFFIHIGVEELLIGGGLYMPKKEALLILREYIAEHPKTFSKAITEKDFIEFWGHVQGEKNKMLPKHLREAASKQALIYNKQFYFLREYSTDIILKKGKDFAPWVLEHYIAAQTFNHFLYQALKGKT